MSTAPGPVDFCWGADNSDVVLRAYGSVAVHENPYGDVVIRQERDALEEEDHFVVVPLQDAEYVAQAIVDKVKEIRSLSPAERQAKHEGQQEEREPRLALPAPVSPTERPTRVARGVA